VLVGFRKTVGAADGGDKGVALAKGIGVMVWVAVADGS
jgi:hypothetical protein